MPWKYCCKCGDEVEKPTITDFEYGAEPACECGEPIDCDVNEIIIENLIYLMREQNGPTKN